MGFSWPVETIRHPARRCIVTNERRQRGANALHYYYVQLARRRRPSLRDSRARARRTFSRTTPRNNRVSNYNPIRRETETSARRYVLTRKETDETTSGPGATKFIYTGRKKKFRTNGSFRYFAHCFGTGNTPV